MKDCLDYEYKYKCFSSYQLLIDFLNYKEIPKENIIKIEKTYLGNVHLLYIKPKDYSEFY